jgi:hypothetical protein
MNEKEKNEGLETPHDSFTKECYRQPSLTEPEILPEPYRNDGSYDIIKSTTGEMALMHDFRPNKRYLGSISLNVHELVDEGEENLLVLRQYFKDTVEPLAVIPPSHHGSEDGDHHDGHHHHHLTNNEDDDDETKPLAGSGRRSVRRGTKNKTTKRKSQTPTKETGEVSSKEETGGSKHDHEDVVMDIEEPVVMTRSRR